MFYNEDAEWCQMVAFISLYTAEALGALGVLIALGWLFVKLQIAENFSTFARNFACGAQISINNFR